MDKLAHNQVIRIMAGPLAGFYRVIFDEPAMQRTVVVRIADEAERPNRNKKRDVVPPSKTRKLPLIGRLHHFDRDELTNLDETLSLSRVEVEPEALYLLPMRQVCAKAIYEKRCRVMESFLDFDRLQESIIVHGGLGELVREAMQRERVSRGFVYGCWTLLCRFGINERSLRPRFDRCGAPGVRRPCDPGGRKKAGRKTEKQRLAAKAGKWLPPDQPGMSTEWTKLIMAADRDISTPKPPMPERIECILHSRFILRYRQEGGKLIEIAPEPGTYPLPSQVRRVLQVEIPRLERLLQQTTQGHFNRNMRGTHGRAWQGIAGPGHVWQIDSTIGDIYLRSAVNRAWIVGRPIVYVIVDVWSTAVVGFYVCLEGPSWAMAKLALFSAGADPALVSDLWGYQLMPSLNPVPTLSNIVQCDRGEYLSHGASETSLRLMPMLSYAPPYRPDLRGTNEVLHRIEKDKQYQFVPGTIDARREEYELRRFNPESAVLTVREYVHYLTIVFAEYNLTADRRGRCDAHMIAEGAFPSPAGLWRWGHAAGIGFRRHVSKSDLVTTFMPSADATVTRRGVRFAGREYVHPKIDEERWTTEARNFGSWTIPIHYFPGTVSRIWTPDVPETGMLELQLSDHSTAAAELTFDEVADAYSYERRSRQEVEHERLMSRLERRSPKLQIVRNGKQLTEEAIAKDCGVKPSIRDARFIDIAANSKGLKPSASSEMHGGSVPNPEPDEAREGYTTIMKSIFSNMNREGGSDGQG